MIDYKIIDRIVVSVAIPLAAIFVSIVVAMGADQAKRSFTEANYYVNIWPLILATLLAMYLVNRVIYVERQQKFTAQQEKIASETAAENEKIAADKELKSLKAELTRTIGELQRDIVTGIPNQRKLISDLNYFCKTEVAIDSHQIIMIDLFHFGLINDTFGWEKGDEVMRYVAQSIFQSMRRNEEIYKKPIGGEEIDEDIIRRRLYRKYTGGDEFVAILRGSEGDALGYLSRLNDDFATRFSPYASEILGTPWTLSFHAGLCALIPGEQYEAAMKRVGECLRIARQEGSPSRVFWSSRKRDTDFEPGSRSAQQYKLAIEKFAIPLDHS